MHIYAHVLVHVDIHDRLGLAETAGAPLPGNGLGRSDRRAAHTPGPPGHGSSDPLFPRERRGFGPEAP